MTKGAPQCLNRWRVFAEALKSHCARGAVEAFTFLGSESVGPALSDLTYFGCVDTHQ
jgi:hypothetical protein